MAQSLRDLLASRLRAHVRSESIPALPVIRGHGILVASLALVPDAGERPDPLRLCA